MRNSWGFLVLQSLIRLDIGDGKEVDLKECPRSKLRQQCIKYLGPEDLRHRKVPLLLVVKEKDDKLKRIAKEMFHEVDHGARSIDNRRDL
ncbi:IQ domain-containing protein IQM3 [Camellia lanceoleosa]|uniref:IQ domain-containing protein IQM3 n=1 Tax=Camellia lanceoleosa TaxID=1840588 RepID=A0ACC0GBE5_9ERIC|nr:IQ domain-containing protein IQM3 [Camellia lanceoleosa]